jgi:hypothetical protein
MAIAKEDIKDGFYWIRYSGMSDLDPFIVQVKGDDCGYFNLGLSITEPLADFILDCDFIARVEPPEGV